MQKRDSFFPGRFEAVNGSWARAARSTGLFVALIVVTIGITYLVFKLPERLPETKGLDARWRSQELSGYRTTLLAILAGVLATVGAYFTWDNVRISRRSHQTDRFAKALQLLADDKPAVRVGGVYALYAVARESPREVQPVINALQVHVEDVEGSGTSRDRAVARDVLAKLDPDAARSEVIASESLVSGVAAIFAAIGFAVSLTTEDFSGAPGAVRTFFTLAAGPLLLAVLWALWSNRGRGRAAEDLQRPLFAAKRALVFKAGDGWVVDHNVRPDRGDETYATQKKAIAAAEALLSEDGGELRIFSTSGGIQASRIVRPKGAEGEAS